MKRKFLEDQGLDKEVIDKIMTEHGKTVQGFADYDTIKTENEELKSQAATTETTLKDLQAQAGNSEELQKKLDDTVKEYDTFKATIADKEEKRKFNDALDSYLIDQKARNPISVKAHLNMDSLELQEDGTIKGIEDQVKTLVEKEAYLFDLGKNQSGYKPNGGNNADDVPATMHDAIKDHYENQT